MHKLGMHMHARACNPAQDTCTPTHLHRLWCCVWTPHSWWAGTAARSRLCWAWPPARARATHHSACLAAAALAVVADLQTYCVCQPSFFEGAPRRRGRCPPALGPNPPPRPPCLLCRCPHLPRRLQQTQTPWQLMHAACAPPPYGQGPEPRHPLCMCASVRACVRACLCVCVRVCVRASVRVRMCVCTCACVWACVCLHTCAGVCWQNFPDHPL